MLTPVGQIRPATEEMRLGLCFRPWGREDQRWRGRGLVCASARGAGKTIDGGGEVWSVLPPVGQGRPVGIRPWAKEDHRRRRGGVVCASARGAGKTSIEGARFGLYIRPWGREDPRQMGRGLVCVSARGAEKTGDGGDEAWAVQPPVGH